MEVILTGKHEMEEALSSPFSRVKTISVRKDYKIPNQWQSYIREKKISIQTISGRSDAPAIQMHVLWNLFSEFKEVERFLDDADRSLVVFLDHLQDPHNVGNVIRTAHFFGASCVVIPSSRSAKMGETVIRTSSGAALSIPILYGGNLVRQMQNFQKKGFYIWGLSPHVDPILSEETTFLPKIGLVVGSEGEGMASLTEKTCDQLYRLSKTAHRDSLNASSAASIAIYECAKKIFS